MIVDVTNEVYGTLKSTLTDVNVLQAYPETEPTFPCVVIEDSDNSVFTGTHDSSGDHHNEVSLEISIFTSGDTKVSSAKEIRNRVDAIMTDTFNMERTDSRPQRNYADSGIYKYFLKYSSIIDSNKVIYRR